MVNKIKPDHLVHVAIAEVAPATSTMWIVSVCATIVGDERHGPR
jgi:hypothetical protein